ncbi:unnamed protein product [Rotaria sp. Silwood1]|nr:unnamed protein product [Rotaria sp. Silwood1]
MKYSCVQWNDLPDEILMIILKNLTNAEVLYSLLGVNKRLNNIAVDPVFTNNLSLVMSTSDGLVYSLSDPILDRFCLYILPKIHQNIEWLHLQSRSMERFLRATNFPNLYGISLHNIQAKTAIDLFTEQTTVIHTLKKQLLSFIIDISTKGTECYKRDNNAIIFNHILTMFTNLQYLNFDRSSIYDDRLFFCMRRPTVVSTNLLELHVSLHTFDDCLYLLDGHFNQLHSLYVDVSGIFKSVREVSLFDERPFEHEFFLQSAQSFPFLEKLYECNHERQMYKECSKSIIKYPYLKQLDIICTCKDYHKQFLFDTKTCLSFDVHGPECAVLDLANNNLFHKNIWTNKVYFE